MQPFTTLALLLLALFNEAGALSAAVCKTSEYCCPAAKHCLTPTAKACGALLLALRSRPLLPFD
eukprot:SAG22_NODE_1774_length_3609_cov_3.611681_5_plen_64_part_00